MVAQTLGPDAGPRMKVLEKCREEEINGVMPPVVLDFWTLVYQAIR